MDQAGERGVQLSVAMEGTLCDQVPPESKLIYVLGEPSRKPCNHQQLITKSTYADV